MQRPRGRASSDSALSHLPREGGTVTRTHRGREEASPTARPLNSASQPLSCARLSSSHLSHPSMAATSLHSTPTPHSSRSS